jgi:hypothetical protein
MVETGRSALARGDDGAALEAMDRYRRAFPHGQLVEEAEAITIQALAASGRRAEAKTRAEGFVVEHPHGLFRSVVERAVGHGSPQPPPAGSSP